MNYYAFDVDETLEVSGGPVKLQQLIKLKSEGHVIGLNGNWAQFVHNVRGWHNLISFFNAGVGKPELLAQIKMYAPKGDRYVMVGNDGVTGASLDKQAAEMAGWEFVLEKDFKEGLE